MTDYRPVTFFSLYQELSSEIISCQSPATPRRLHHALVPATHSLTPHLHPHSSPSLSILGLDPGKRALSEVPISSSLWRATPRTSHPRAYTIKSRAAREAFIKAMNDPVNRTSSLYSNPTISFKGPSSHIQASGTNSFKSESFVLPLR